MKTQLALLGALASFLTLPAYAAPQATWSQLIEKAIQEGRPIDTELGEFRALSHLVPADENAPHQADYFSTIGFLDPEGKYVPFTISVVSENWSINTEGNWLIDQWILEVDLDGILERAGHHTIVETMEQIVLDYTTIPAERAEAESVWNGLRANWLQWTGAEGRTFEP